MSDPFDPLDRPQSLPRLAEPSPQTAFESLRAHGIRRAQALAGGVWSDYNQHDPGITMLEAACFALTELVYRADFSVADHLADERNRVEWAAHGLHPPAQAFPCRPTTVDDLRRWLLDRHPALDGVTVQPDTGLPGVLHLSLDAAPGMSAQQRQGLAHRVRHSAAAMRNLGEDLGQVRVLEERLCTLHLRLGVTGARDAADVVAEVFDRLEAYLGAAAELDGLADPLAQGLTPQDWFEGPPLKHGRVPQQQLDRARAPTLFVSELVACVKAVAGVEEVAGLALAMEGEAPRSDSLAWRQLDVGTQAHPHQHPQAPGPCWTLALRPPEDDAAIEHVQVHRRGKPVPIPPAALMQRLARLRAARRARRRGVAVPADTLPVGRYLPPPPHYPLQFHLPEAYGVGERGVGAGAGPLAQRHAAQLRGYLALLDQVVAHGGAQISHLRELFRNDAGAAPSYRWQVLDGTAVHGLEALLDAGAEAIEAEACVPLDAAVERRSRLLDVLLALHGEVYTQHSLRHFLDHLAPRERECWLLRNKQALASEVATLSRDRGAGFDPGQPSWNQPGNSALLQRRVALLLEFGPGYSRALAGSPWPGPAAGDEASAAGEARPRRERPALVLAPLDLDLPETAPSSARDLLGLLELPPSLLPGEQALLQRLPRGLRGPHEADVPLPPALLHCAARHDRYVIEPQPDGSTLLLLGPDADGAWWPLARLSAQEAGMAGLAQRLAHVARQAALARDRAGEGLHVVEHLLLRPVGGALPHAGVPEDFFVLQLSVVLPGWTLRSRQRAFRELARETVQANLPAHLEARCLWLDEAAMHNFESAYETWLNARLRWSEEPEDAQRCRALNAWSAALVGWLLKLRQADDGADSVAPAEGAGAARDGGQGAP